MKVNQISKVEKMNIIGYVSSLKDQLEQARKNENMSLEIDTANMLVGARNILKLLEIDGIIQDI